MKEDNLKMTRRQFLQVSAAAGAAAAVGGVKFAAEALADEAADPDADLTYVRTTCAPNCTGGCGQKACVQNGEIKTIIQASDYEDAEHNPRGCLKGLSFSNLIYGPYRMHGPMIRRGAPGSDDLEEVSWEEALDYTGSELRRIIDTYERLCHVHALVEEHCMRIRNYNDAKLQQYFSGVTLDYNKDYSYSDDAKYRYLEHHKACDDAVKEFASNAYSLGEG